MNTNGSYAMNTPESEPAPRYRIDGALLMRDLPLLALLLLDFGYGAYSLSGMPAQVPIHWGIDGTPDRYGPAWVNALLIPAIGVGTYLLMLVLPLIDPRRRNYGLFGDTLRFFRWTLVLFAIGLHVTLVQVSLGSEVAVDFVVRLGIALLFVALGNHMGRLRQNWFIGIRVPWTLANEEVWNRTHRAAGRLWVIGGLLLVGAAFLPPRSGAMALGAVLAVLVVVPIVHAWVLHRRIAGA
jgi:uncharacterized membrane protein